MGAIEIRAMNRADIERVAAIHLAAFPGFFLTFLGARFLRLFYSEAVELSQIALVATEGPAVVGFVMGSCRPGAFFKAIVRRKLVRFALATLSALMRDPRHAPRLVRALRKPKEAARPDDTATLMSLAVDPCSQTRGVGGRLVRAFLNEAGRRGASSVDLTTDMHDNERANAFYQRQGFSYARTIVTPEKRILVEYVIRIPVTSARAPRQQ